jgi:hypothetical protein
MTIVTYVHKPKRPPKRRAQPVAIPKRIVNAKAQQPAAPVIDEPVIERKRQAQPAAITGPRIVTAKKPGPRHAIGPEQIAAARDAARADPPQAARKSAIVTALSPKSGRFGPVPDFDAEEHQRRGDAAVALFRELVRRPTWNAGT